MIQRLVLDFGISNEKLDDNDFNAVFNNDYGQIKPNDMYDKKLIDNLYKKMYQAMIAKDIAALDTILAEGSVCL